MEHLLEKVFRKLLTELRNITSGPPSANVYYAMQFKNGYVGYYDMKPEPNGGMILQPLDPADPNRFRNKIVGRYVQEVDENPELKAAAEELMRLGFVKIVDKKETYKDITSRYNKKLFPTPEDVPDVTQQYSEGTYDFRSDNTLKVDHNKKVIDLDQNYTQANPRRTDPRKRGGADYRGPSYVIPSGKVAFANNQLGLQKMLKFLMQQDPRMTPDYKFVGDEKYRTMTVGQLVEKPGEVETALTGLGKLVMFHGTSEKRWNAIQKKGLRPGSAGEVYFDMVSGWSENNVYLTFSHANAENYATRQAIKDGSKAAVLRVEVPDTSRLVADEDSFGFITFSRPYQIQVKSRYGDEESYTVTSEHVKNMLDTFGEKRVKMDEEGQALYKELMQHINNELPKKSLKGGTIAYRGMIPPKFIQLDMVYSKTPFKTPEQKGGPSDEEYKEIRTGVQKTAKRYDESLRHFIANVILEMHQSH